MNNVTSHDLIPGLLVGSLMGFFGFPAEENAVSCLSCGLDGTLLYESPKERELLRRDRRPFALQLLN